MANFDAADIQDSDIYLTLPFDAFATDCEAVDTVVEQTRAKWQWFHDGQRRNPALGTLSYLPVEVRWLIWMQLSPRVITKPESAFYLWWPSSMTDGGGPVSDGEEHIPTLHKALPLVALEIDQLYLTKTTLHLNANLRFSSLWCHKLAPWQLPWLRHLSIILETEDGQPRRGQGERWIEIFDTRQFPNLSTLVVDVEHLHGEILDSYYLDFEMDICGGILCKNGRKPTMTYKDHRKYYSNILRRELAVLEVVTKVAMRRTPGVKIQLGKMNVLCEICHDKCKAILDELE
ncbi:MAG: hypothetical protein LQ346_006913 [Caloplaca aetnensis]|nr:MAG: hypothetical protein LQ346_006913 [Caloplaca aetnensis]